MWVYILQVVYLGIGSNMGEREENCLRAVGLLGENGLVAGKTSSIYETEPWGVSAQPRFKNMAVEIETDLSPGEILNILKNIEKKMGRAPSTEKWGPRIIDIDILLLGDMVIRGEGLEIPHPRMHERRFVLLPLSEIAPGAVHPPTGKTIRELLSETEK